MPEHPSRNTSNRSEEWRQRRAAQQASTAAAFDRYTGLAALFDRNAKIEAAARKVVDAATGDDVTAKEWAFDTPSPIREAIIQLEDVLDGRAPE